MGKLLLAGMAAIAFSAAPAFSQEISRPPGWSAVKAAAYLDQRAVWWITPPKAARDHGTFCISCHTAAPFALSRSALRVPLAETAPSTDEQRILENVVKRVRLWSEVAPLYADQSSGLPKTSESRGTESILNALILAWNDAPSSPLSPDARFALDNMWTLQFKTSDMKGSWAWLQFHNAPWEGDSQFYGTALAALAVGCAPGDYQAKPEIQEGVRLLREWLVKNMDGQTPMDRVVLLWASARLRGLLTPAQQQAVVDEVLARQEDDGGFSMSSLAGPWKRADKTPLDTAEDGYATGLIAFTLEQLGTPDANRQLLRSLARLRQNQNQTDGRWAASSLNKNRASSSDAGLFMSDAATAYAVAGSGWRAVTEGKLLRFRS